MDAALHNRCDELLERASALDLVDGLASAAVAGTGQVAIIEAPAGLGKTALLDAYAARLIGLGLRVVRAHGSDLERDFSYGVVRQLLGSLVRSRDLELDPIEGVDSPLRVLLEGPDVDLQRPPAEPRGLMHALYWAIADVADRRTLALLVDDAHDADAPSARFLSFLVRRIVDLPVLLVIATRPPAPDGAGDTIRGIAEDRNTQRLQLRALSPEAVGSLVARAMATPPDDEFAEACCTATGGIPFYVHEIIHAMLDSGHQPRTDALGWLAETGPPGIVRRMLGRLGGLAAETTQLARACAVLGDEAELRTCALLAGIAPDVAAQAADALVREGILRAGARLTFVHSIVRAAVLADLGEHSARRWHGRAARILLDDHAAAEHVAVHVMRAEPSREPWERDVLWQAGRAAAERGSPGVAVQLLRTAIDHGDGTPDADLQYDLGRAQYSVGDPAGLPLMAAGAVGCADEVERARRALRVANFQMRSGDLAEAVELLDRVRPAVAADAELTLTLDCTRYWAARLHGGADGSRVAGAAELLARADGPDTPARRLALALLGCEAAQTASREQALALLDRALRPPGLLTFVAFDAVAVQATMLSLLAAENTGAFEELADAVLGEAGRHGNLLTFLGVSTFRAMALLHRGDLGGADVEAREATRSATEQGWQHGAGGLVALRAISLLEKGNVADAQRCLADAATMHVPPGFPQALLLSARGRVAAETGDPAHGVEQLLACGRTLEGMRIRSPGVIPWRSEAAILMAVAGNYDQARELASTEVDLARTLSGPLSLARALYSLAQATGGAGRLELLDEAWRVAQADPTTLTRAMICVEFGAALRRNKQPGDARVHLSEGLEVAARCRCLPLVNRAREELAVLGVTPRRTLAYGPDALTPSEVRVGRMAAQGMSNTEIAQRLFVTRKTVEKHLASAYRKLGIDSRTQLRLADLVERSGAGEHAPPAGQK